MKTKTAKPAATYRARLNRALNRPARLVFMDWAIAAKAARRALAIRCKIYADNHGFTGTRATFGGVA